MTARDPILSDATQNAANGVNLRAALRSAEGLVGKGQAGWMWLETTRLMRANQRIRLTRANLLAGGVSYAALFSLFAALTVGVTVIMVVLDNNPKVRDTAIRAIADAVPGILDVGEGGLVDPASLQMSTALNPTTIISAAIAIWAARAMVMALRRSLRSVAGINFVENPVKQAGRDIAALTILGLSIMVTSALVVAAQAFGNTVLGWLGVEGRIAGFLILASAYVITFLVDFGLFIYLFRFLAGIRPPRHDLLLGAGLGAAGSGILRVVGTALIGAPENPLLASAAALVTILLLVNIIVRMTLYVTAFMVNPPAPVIAKAPDEVRFHSTPNYVTLSDPSTLTWDHDPTIGAVVPNPSLHPAYVPATEHEPTPKWGGLIGRMKRRRIERLEAQLEAAREHYYA